MAAVVAELEAGGRLGSSLGLAAVQIAKRMSDFDTDGGLVALNKELRATMAAALQNAAIAADPLDELRSRRDAKRASTG